MRVALFGGTFDPIHRGHVAIATAAADRFDLDRVLFTPTGRQPLKADHTVASFDDRLTMVTLACEADSRFTASDLDAPHPDGTPNYTIDTLHALIRLYPSATLFHLVGADSFHHLGHWREPETILALTDWIVVSRPGFPLKDPEGLTLTQAQRARIRLLDEVHDPVSATLLRERLKAGDPCDDLLPAPVAAFIRHHGLYR